MKIVEELRRGIPTGDELMVLGGVTHATIMLAAADEIEKRMADDAMMQARIDELKEALAVAIEALEPFGEVADDFDADGRDLEDTDGIYANTAGDFRRARAAAIKARSVARASDGGEDE